MRTTIALWNVVGVAVNVFLEAVVPLHGHFDADAVFAISIEMENLIHRGFAFVKVLNERPQTAFKVKQVFFISHTLIFQEDAHTRVQKRQFTQTLGQVVVAEDGCSERFFGRQEAHSGALAIGYTNFFQWVVRYTVGVFLFKYFAVAANGQLQLLRQRVYYGYAHTVQTTGNLIRVVVELTARVQYGQNNLSGGYTLFRVQFSWNTTTVIRYRYRVIFMDDHIHLITVAGQCFVDGVIHDLEHHMMQTRTVIGIANVHAWAFAYGIQPLQDFNTRRIVILLVTHVVFLLMNSVQKGSGRMNNPRL